MLLFVKHRFFNMSGLGIFLDNGNIDPVNFIKGFWSVEAAGGYPYAYAFWFIRNLMVFTILSPIAWLIGRRHTLALMIILVYIVLGVSLYGFEWYVAGSYFSLHYHKINAKLWFQWKWLISASTIFWACVIVDIYDYEWHFPNFIILLQTLSALFLSLYLSKLLSKNKLISTLIPSTFMIYATHQCYCTVIKKAYVEIIGDSTIFNPVAAYLLCFLTLVFLGFLSYLFLHRYAPRLLRVLTGNR